MVLRKHELEAKLKDDLQLVKSGVLRDENPLDDSEEFQDLLLACRKGDLKRTQVLISAGVNINGKDKFDYTPLIIVSPFPLRAPVAVVAMPWNVRPWNIHLAELTTAILPTTGAAPGAAAIVMKSVLNMLVSVGMEKLSVPRPHPTANTATGCKVGSRVRVKISAGERMGMIEALIRSSPRKE